MLQCSEIWPPGFTWFRIIYFTWKQNMRILKPLHVQRHDRQHKVRTMWGLWWANLRQVRPLVILFIIKVSDDNISQTIFNQLNQVCDASVRQFLARGLSLLFTGLTYLPLRSFWWFFNSSSFAKAYSRPRPCQFWALSRYCKSLLTIFQLSKRQIALY